MARQDPAADLIRAVGPNLLIALLMDGPQLKDRWAARYASVLAEDPGSSVLTLTRLGMARRSRPFLRTTGRRAEPSQVIALWRDAGGVKLAEQVANERLRRAGVTLGKDLDLPTPRAAKKDRFSPSLIKRLAGGR